jgi:hypothetical protein
VLDDAGGASFAAARPVSFSLDGSEEEEDVVIVVIVVAAAGAGGPGANARHCRSFMAASSHLATSSFVPLLHAKSAGNSFLGVRT